MSQSTSNQDDDKNIIRPFSDHAKIDSANGTINCQVCNAIISMAGKESQVVVKCTECNEATPLKGAPPGKQYVRCPCRCLLICRASSSKIGCPRKSCGRTIVLASTQDSVNATSAINNPQNSYGTIGSESMTGIQISCGSCGFSFSVNPMRQQSFCNSEVLSRFANCLNNGNGGSILSTNCPHCYKISSVGPGYARVRWVGFSLIALLILIIGIILCAFTQSNSAGLIVVDCVIFIISLAFFIKAGMFYSMPISRPEQNFERV